MAVWKLTVQHAAEVDIDPPDLPSFRQSGDFRPDHAKVPAKAFDLEHFRVDPKCTPLSTPSGQVEISSEDRVLQSRGPQKAADVTREGGVHRQCPLGRLSAAAQLNRPVTRLHSQYDFGKTSRDAEIDGCEPIRIHPCDAEARGIADGDIVCGFNDRGATFAGAVVTDKVRPGVVMLRIGA